MKDRLAQINSEHVQFHGMPPFSHSATSRADHPINRWTALVHAGPLRRARRICADGLAKAREMNSGGTSDGCDTDLRFPKEARGLLRRRGTNIEARTPFESGDVGEFGHDLEVPVVVLVCSLPPPAKYAA
jgi:hypothetical protein